MPCKPYPVQRLLVRYILTSARRIYRNGGLNHAATHGLDKLSHTTELGLSACSIYYNFDWSISFLKRVLISLCAVLTIVGAVYLIYNAVLLMKDDNVEETDTYKGYTQRYPMSNVSIMIPDEFEVVKADDVNQIETGETMVVPYDEFYKWETSSYVGSVIVTSEQNSMEPRAYMEACAIPTYEEYYSALDLSILAREAGSIGEYPAAALTFRYTVDYESGVTKTFRAYSVYLQQSGYIYTTTFVCEDWDFEARKPVYDKIAESIVIGEINIQQN